MLRVPQQCWLNTLNICKRNMKILVIRTVMCPLCEKSLSVRNMHIHHLRSQVPSDV